MTVLGRALNAAAPSWCFCSSFTFRTQRHEAQWEQECEACRVLRYHLLPAAALHGSTFIDQQLEWFRLSGLKLLLLRKNHGVKVRQRLRLELWDLDRRREQHEWTVAVLRLLVKDGKASPPGFSFPQASSPLTPASPALSPQMRKDTRPGGGPLGGGAGTVGQSEAPAAPSQERAALPEAAGQKRAMSELEGCWLKGQL